MKQIFILSLMLFLILLCPKISKAEEQTEEKFMIIYSVDFYNNNNESILNDIQNNNFNYFKQHGFGKFIINGEDNLRYDMYSDINDKSPNRIEAKEGLISIGTYIIINSMEVNQWTNTEYIEKILKENNINESVDEIFFFNRDYINTDYADKNNPELNYKMEAFIKTKKNIYWAKIMFSYISKKDINKLEFKLKSLKILSVNDFCKNYKLTKGSIFLDNTIYQTENKVLFADGKSFIPLRSLVEAIGGKVDWDSKTNNIKLMYNNEYFICECNQAIGYIQMYNLKNENLNQLEKYINLGGWDKQSGRFYMINDRTMLTQQTGISLLNYFNYDVKVDVDNLKLVLNKRT